MSLGELASSLGMDKEELPPSPPLPPVAGNRENTGITGVGELAMYFTECNMWESRPCTSPEQQSRAASLVAEVVSELTSRV